MDGSTIDHSDSDSGESWTLLEPSPAYGEDAPELCNNHYTLERDAAETNIEKDEDTDGISVISDSDPESTPCEVTSDRYLPVESHPTEQHKPPYISVDPFPSHNINDTNTMGRDEDFLGDSNGKHKTYVHRRNKRLSTVLNIIMLGSVITAAGVAIGHMWGARNECPMHTTPSVNKILSNLYKLQEENAYLRNKLKELTLAGHVQLSRRKPESEKSAVKQPRCKKLYEEPLHNRNAEMKCIDNENNNYEKKLDNSISQLQYEKDFANDIDKLKDIYQQNKNWLDDEIAKRMRYEEQILKNDKMITITEEPNTFKDENLKKQTESDSKIKFLTNIEALQAKSNKLSTEQKISYADSLKSEHKQIRKSDKIVPDDVHDKSNKDHVIWKEIKKNNILFQNNVSEDDFKKDDRYIAPQSKQDKKKRDRQKLHKKQKRKNKYEQWEMKGGYMKDYDDFSISSSQDNDYTLKKPDKNFLSRDFERNNYIYQFTENDENAQSVKTQTDDQKTKSEKTEKFKVANGKNLKNWYENRAAVRADARKKLEYELFGEFTPNNAGWYFRRMQKREQCRAQRDNSTFRKLSKQKMNFKMKH